MAPQPTPAKKWYRKTWVIVTAAVVVALLVIGGIGGANKKKTTVAVVVVKPTTEKPTTEKPTTEKPTTSVAASVEQVTALKLLWNSEPESTKTSICAYFKSSPVDAVNTFMSAAGSGSYDFNTVSAFFGTVC